MNLVSTFPLNTVEDFGPVFITLGAIGEKPDEVRKNRKIYFCLINSKENDVVVSACSDRVGDECS